MDHPRNPMIECSWNLQFVSITVASKFACLCVWLVALGQMSIHSILALTITSTHMLHGLKSTTRKWCVCIWFSIENTHTIDSMAELRNDQMRSNGYNVVRLVWSFLMFACARNVCNIHNMLYLFIVSDSWIWKVQNENFTLDLLRWELFVWNWNLI